MSDFAINNRTALQSQGLAFGESVVYRQKSSQTINDDGRLGRGNTTDITISKAIRGRVSNDKALTEKGKLRTSDTSFQIDSADLALSPKAGDRIIASSGLESFHVLWFEDKTGGSLMIYCRK